jgi:hypothetical protein
MDVFVLLAGLILIFRLRIYGSILGGAPGQPQVDWLLLLSPLALLLGSAAILLRVFPALLTALAAWVSRERGIVATLSLWRAARDPTHIARLVLLLTLAMALGLFSSGLNATLDRNERDQSQYTVGSDVRVANLPHGGKDTLSIVQGVQTVSPARREQGTIAVQSEHGYPAFEMLAVDTDSIGDAIRFRDDFAAQPIDALLTSIERPTPAQPVLAPPASYDRLGLWCWLPVETRSLAPRLRVEAKLASLEGTMHRFRLRLDQERSRPDEGWYYYEGQPQEAASPRDLNSLWFSSRLSGFQGQIEHIALGDLVAIDTRSGVDEVWEEAKSASWHVYGRNVRVQLGGDPADAWLHLLFEQGEMQTGTWYGLQLGDSVAAARVPALISRGFQEQSGLDVGDQVGTWVDSEPLEFVVAGIVDYFPTLYEADGTSFAITALGPFLKHANGLTPDPIYANEAFVRLSADASLGPITSALPDLRISDAESVRKAIKADPLALGLRSVTLFGYVLTTILSLAGFGTHFYMSTRQHGRTYAVLRALGLSARQLYGMLVFEQTLLIFSGLGLGTVLGLLLNRLTLPGLPLSLGGRPPVPPFLAQTDWRAVAGVYLTLALAFVASLALATGMLWQARLHQLLRVDEE